MGKHFLLFVFILAYIASNSQPVTECQASSHMWVSADSGVQLLFHEKLFTKEKFQRTSGSRKEQYCVPINENLLDTIIKGSRKKYLSFVLVRGQDTMGNCGISEIGDVIYMLTWQVHR